MGKNPKIITSKPTNVEEVLEALGGFGRFQVLALTIILFFDIPCNLMVYIPVFTGATPSRWLCGTEEISKEEICSCEGNLTALEPGHSIVAEWGLVCETAWVSDTIVSIQMSGMILGNIISPLLSDWYGRKYCFFGIIFQMFLGSVLSAIAPNPYVYAVARFICGAGFSASLSMTSAYTMEFLSPQWRMIPNAVNPTGEGIFLLGVLAYFIRPWRTLMWTSVAPFLLAIVAFPFLPESPRFLLRNNRIEEAHKVFKYIAKVNGRDPIDIETLRLIAEKERPVPNGPDQENMKVKRFTYVDFYRDSYLRKTTLCLQGLWLSWGLVYFGISYNIKNLSGDPYINMMYLGLTDMIAYPMSLFVNNAIGRRRSVVAFMTLSAVFLVLIAVLQLSMDMQGYGTLVAVLCFLGKYGSAGARSVARTLTGESYPTAMRTMGISLGAGTTPLGGILAPQVAYLGTIWPSAPFFLFAFVSIGGSFVSLLLAEMDGKPLMEEVSDNKNKGQAIVPVLLPSERKNSFEELCPDFSSVVEKTKL